MNEAFVGFDSAWSGKNGGIAWASFRESRLQDFREPKLANEQRINNINFFLRSNYTPSEYLRQVCDQFDVVYLDGERSGTVMCIPLRAVIIGVPLRIKYLDFAWNTSARTTASG